MKYLGVMISSDGNMEKEGKDRKCSENDWRDE